MYLYIESFFFAMFLHIGLLLGATLQNVFIFNQILQKKSTKSIIIIFTITSMVSAAIGIYGFNFIIKQIFLKYVLGLCGITLILYNALIAYKNGKNGRTDQNNYTNIVSSIGIVFLNPHIYTDMFVVYTIAISYSNQQYITIILGFATMACIWFTLLSIFTKKILKIYNSQKLYKRLNYISATILVLIATYTAWDIYNIH